MDQSVIDEQVSFEESALSTAISSFEDRQFFSMQNIDYTKGSGHQKHHKRSNAQHERNV